MVTEHSGVVYSVENVKKFVDENLDKLGTERATAILKRAHRSSPKGTFPQGLARQILGDDDLAQEFEQVVVADTEHTRIALAGIRNS